jgi:hypothetical protein
MYTIAVIASSQANDSIYSLNDYPKRNSGTGVKCVKSLNTDTPALATPVPDVRRPDVRITELVTPKVYIYL